MIKVQNVIFEYPNKRALKDVSFEIKEGSITALVGPNGSGKTTLLRCIAALEIPFSGSIHVNGIDALEFPRDVHKNVGYLSDFFGLYKDLSVRQCLIFSANIHKIEESQVSAKVNEVAEKLGITSYLNASAGSLSRGLKQRLGIAQSIIHNPKIILLDEPASGLDPEARINLSKLFLDLKKGGVTIIVSSHILAELEDYCTEMLLIREGRIIGHHNSDKQQNVSEAFTLEIILCDEANKYKNAILNIEGIDSLSFENNIIKCNTSMSEKKLNNLLQILIQKNIPVYSFIPQQKRLQDIYMDYASGDK
jgi:ABC-2 type transport system ATP-binding protein